MSERVRQKSSGERGASGGVGKSEWMKGWNREVGSIGKGN